MTTTTVHATGTFKTTSWDEKPYAELEGAPKLTHAHVITSYQGDFEGEGTSDSLMFYGNQGTATYFGVPGDKHDGDVTAILLLHACAS